MAHDYRIEILRNLSGEFEQVDWVELPDPVRDLTGNFSRLEPTIEYPQYLNIWLGHGYEITLGFGDEDPYMWNGVLYWQITDGIETNFFSGEIANGSPRYVLWELFDQFNEQLKERIQNEKDN
jgi:hypothetical protein